MSVTDSLALGTEATIMAVREYLMSYFKNTTGCHLTDSTNVSMVGNQQLPENRRLHSYERHAVELHALRLVKIGKSNLMSLQKNPHKVELYTRTLNRSEEMRAVREGIEKFLEKYLRGVEVSTVQRGTFDGSEDKELLSQNAPENQLKASSPYLDTPFASGFNEYVRIPTAIQGIMPSTTISYDNSSWTTTGISLANIFEDDDED